MLSANFRVPNLEFVVSYFPVARISIDLSPFASVIIPPQRYTDKTSAAGTDARTDPGAQ